jgi:hypothetical protein
MAITKLKQIGDWGVTQDQLAPVRRPVGRPRIIVGLLTGDDAAEIGDSPGAKSGRGSGEPGR